MRYLFTTILALLLPFPQGIGGKAGMGGKAGFGEGPSVYVDSAAYYQSGTLNSCADALTSGNPCRITTSFTIPHTGDAADVTVELCWNNSCNFLTGGTMSVTDGTNTYTAVAAATQAVTTWNQYRFVACNATAGTFTLDFHDSQGDAGFYYVRASTVTLLNANPTTCVDTSVSNVATAFSTSPSVTSAGNVSIPGEMGLAVIQCNGSPSNTGSYSTTNLSSSDGAMVLSSSLVSGAPTTAAGTCSNGNWFASLIAVKP